MTATTIWSSSSGLPYSASVSNSDAQMASPIYNSQLIQQQPTHFAPKALVYPSPNFESYTSGYPNQMTSGYASSSTASPTEYYGIPSSNYHPTWNADLHGFKSEGQDQFWNSRVDNVKLDGKQRKTKRIAKDSESDESSMSGEPKKRSRRYKTPSPQVLRARRQMANARERRRMNNLNVAYEALREVLPEFDSGRRLSKMETLQMANLYIQCLGDLLQDS